MSKPVSGVAIFLHQCLTFSDCKVNYDAVGTALNISADAASKRMSRLKDRIKKSGNNAASKSWSGELDADGTFLFQCITSSECKIDYGKVGAALNPRLSAGATAKRFSRLKTKYAPAESAPAAAPKSKTQTPKVSGLPRSVKRKSDDHETESDEEDTEKPKKKTAKTDAPVKREEDYEAESDLDKSLVLPGGAKRQTRARTTDYKRLLEHSDESDEESSRIPATDGPGSSDDYNDTDSDQSFNGFSDTNWSESEDDVAPPKTPRAKKPSMLPTPAKTLESTVSAKTSLPAVVSPETPTKLSTTVTSTQRSSTRIPKVSLLTPVGLSGLPVLRTYASGDASQSPPRHVRSVSASPGAGEHVSNSTQDAALQEAVALEARERSTSVETQWEDTVESFEDVIPSIEDVIPSIESPHGQLKDVPSGGLLTRVAKWWK
ncbi:uncharacterized protein AB675_11994 [Cyphellophora attinorum]|uniref:Myb-like DNA-binding domain-containing protein n=1 Tax=Cyphellophora attinorum TaxID=1664694 RepID=A0A0N1HRC3_9EURO|nr:uncharacterized protein AB675_11994 [Phialophora attinorum]KPI38287.1 hypothetical protein AB675_11994 [Phialophora attinorum]